MEATIVYWGYIGIMEKSADLGGRVGWLPKAERVKTLFLSPLRPKTRGGGGRGGIPASRSPPPKQPFQPTPTPSPGSHQEVCETSPSPASRQPSRVKNSKNAPVLIGS